jgi:homoaconitase
MSYSTFPVYSRHLLPVTNHRQADEGAAYDKVVEIDLSTLEPHVNGPFTPDRAVPLSTFARTVKEQKWPEKLSAGLIGSCTNSSYEVYHC